ncbi:hypothetical protein GCM10020000_01490 [Streptomyces olivoverticillatus]
MGVVTVGRGMAEMRVPVALGEDLEKAVTRREIGQTWLRASGKGPISLERWGAVCPLDEGGVGGMGGSTAYGSGMSHAVDAVDAAAIALNQRSWIPTVEEVALGREFFTRRDGLEQRLLPGMPTCRDPPRAGRRSTCCGWRTSRAWPISCSRRGGGYLPGSRMVALLGAYADQIRPAVPLADRLTRAWLNDPPSGPPCARTRRPCGGRTGTSRALTDSGWTNPPSE